MASSVVRKCSWISVTPSSSTSTGPLTVSTAANSLRVARILAGLAAASVDGRADQHPERRDDERDDQPDDHRSVRPVLEQREQAKHERKRERQPAPLADRGITKAEPGDEEQDVSGNSSHAGFIPHRAKVESRCKAGQPGLEPGTCGFGDRRYHQLS